MFLCPRHQTKAIHPPRCNEISICFIVCICAMLCNMFNTITHDITCVIKNNPIILNKMQYDQIQYDQIKFD